MTPNKLNRYSAQHSTEIIQPSALLDELVQILYFQPIFTILTGHAIAILITVVFLWNAVPLPWLLPWALVITGQSLVWVYMVAEFRRQPPRSQNSRRAIRIFPTAGAITGILWGATLYWPHIIHDTTSVVFLSIMVLGVTAAGLAVFAPYLSSFVIFSSFTLIPFSLRFFIEGGRLNLTLGTMFLLYFSVLLISGINMRRAVHQAIDLRLENTSLIKDLKIQFGEAEKSREQAEQANISKSKFLAAASHDLRQPLHALGLFVDALESRIQYKEVRDIVGNIRISTEALGDLLNSLLDISKLDAGVMEPRPVDFQLRPLLQRIQTDFSKVAEDKSLRLRIADCSMVINTDPTMLERILRNLVSNAIRYTSSGSVLLGCRRKGNTVNIEVHDTGIGIAEDNLDKIFDEFYQVGNPERDRQKGIGLGLAIVKRLSQLIECPIEVRSTPSRGTVFRISVPFVDKIAEPAAPTQYYINDLKGTQVIIVDDELLIREGMTKVLNEWGCNVIEAESTQQALEKLSNPCQLDIILTDYRLRENQTGLDAISQIQSFCNQHIPAIILTGDTAPERLREAKASGYKLLHKPVSSARLRSLMSYVLEHST